MTTVIPSPYTSEQISAWLRGLLTVAWADGDFDPEEQALIARLTQEELAPTTDLGSLDVIVPQDLAKALGHDKTTAENFLRTAVMVALADGIYTVTEADVLHEFCKALGQKVEALEALRHTLCDHDEPVTPDTGSNQLTSPYSQWDALHPARKWLDGLEVHDPRVARFICKMIPAQCPFERDITLFGRKVVHIPAMCKINPLYEQLVGLRFRALSYLADERGEDISSYC